MRPSMNVYYSDHYTLPLPPGHRFPIEKYRMLRDLLLTENIIHSSDLKESPLASPELLALAHTAEYIEGMRTGSVDEQILKRLGFPWSLGLYDRSCASVGGAIAAMRDALKDGIAGNLAGGTHHSHADRGEGYCVFNDIAVATRLMKREGLAKRIAIIDLDVHQGNGNSSILRQDEGVFIFSMHGEKNYPFIKVPSHLDIALPDGTGDEVYLEHLQDGMIEVRRFDPDYIFYQMGVDPLKEDTLGKLDLSLEGLMRRDELVLSYAKRSGIPVSLALGGGYAKPIELSVRAYANTYRVAKRVFSITSVSG
ncbi:MAG: histone deacetylase [Bdellovibrionales bacterium]|nr:histone deacetylase [Bdellovibrionales bacterium]